MPVKDIWEYLEKREPGQLTKQQFIEFLKIARYEDEGYALLSYDDLHGKPNFSDPMRSELISLSLLPENDNGEYDCTRYDSIKNNFGWLNVYPHPETSLIEEYAKDEMPKSAPNDRLIGLLAYSVFFNLDTAARVVANIYHAVQQSGISLNQCIDRLGNCWKIVESSVGKEKAQSCLADFYMNVHCYDLHGATLDFYQIALYERTDSDKKNEPVRVRPDETVIDASKRLYKEFENYCKGHYGVIRKPSYVVASFSDGPGITVPY
ncbi:hypothetical protein IM774_12440 [Erysipelotrichaceae bacterium RD49]|nr:hypothetical protein [Erysipelotrichaceae bacterium RD49]